MRSDMRTRKTREGVPPHRPRRFEGPASRTWRGMTSGVRSDLGPRAGGCRGSAAVAGAVRPPLGGGRVATCWGSRALRRWSLRRVTTNRGARPAAGGVAGVAGA